MKHSLVGPKCPLKPSTRMKETVYSDPNFYFVYRYGVGVAVGVGGVGLCGDPPKQKTNKKHNFGPPKPSIRAVMSGVVVT